MESKSITENLPFLENKISETNFTREFSPDVEDSELKWHQDLKDRKITVIEDGGWFFQMDDDLPHKLKVAEQIFIPKFVWHRVIKGNGKLIVEIQE